MNKWIRLAIALLVLFVPLGFLAHYINPSAGTFQWFLPIVVGFGFVFVIITLIYFIYWVLDGFLGDNQ